MARRPPLAKTINSWINSYTDLLFDGQILICKVCDIILSPQKSVVVKHVSSRRHQCSIKPDHQKQFNLDLVKFMVGCNISWNQLENPVFREFINNCLEGQYLEVELQSETSLRKVYLPQLAENVFLRIRQDLEGKYIWVSLDGTTNSSGVKVVHVLVGAMNELTATRAHLIASKELPHTNAESIASFMSNSLKMLWGDSFDTNKEKFLLFITDTADDMKAAGQLLLQNYDCLHVTCAVHTLHRVAETIKKCYPEVDTLITTIKKVFRKAPDREQLFLEMLPDVELPPEPVLTKWGTWLEAARYYYLYLEHIKRVLQQLNPNNAVAIANAQEAVNNSSVQESLQEIHNFFSRIPLTIQQLESSLTEQLSLTEALNLLYDLRQYLFFTTGESAEKVKKKFEDVLKLNTGLPTLSLIVKLFNKEEVDFAVDRVHQKSLKNYWYFRYAPITSVDVEQVFPLYKWMFSDRIHRFTTVNIERILIIYFYYYAEH